MFFIQPLKTTNMLILVCMNAKSMALNTAFNLVLLAKFNCEWQNQTNCILLVCVCGYKIQGTPHLNSPNSVSLQPMLFAECKCHFIVHRNYCETISLGTLWLALGHYHLHWHHHHHHHHCGSYYLSVLRWPSHFLLVKSFSLQNLCC